MRDLQTLRPSAPACDARADGNGWLGGSSGPGVPGVRLSLVIIKAEMPPARAAAHWHQICLTNNYARITRIIPVLSLFYDK